MHNFCMDRVYMLRESLGESVHFAYVRECQGKSGKIAMVM